MQDDFESAADGCIIIEDLVLSSITTITDDLEGAARDCMIVVDCVKTYAAPMIDDFEATHADCAITMDAEVSQNIQKISINGLDTRCVTVQNDHEFGIFRSVMHQLDCIIILKKKIGECVYF